MQLVFSIGPWLMDLINPPPRNTLTLAQKVWRSALITVTLVTLCIVVALVLSLGCFAWQRGREFAEGPQVWNGLTILLASILINSACIFALLQIKKLDRKFVPPADLHR